MLINVAYGDDGGPLPPNRLVMNDKWIGGIAGAGYTTADRFDVIAKADGELTQAQLRPALQRLLGDRFKLVVHRGKKELPVYHLVLARGDGRLGLATETMAHHRQAALRSTRPAISTSGRVSRSAL